MIINEPARAPAPSAPLLGTVAMVQNRLQLSHTCAQNYSLRAGDVIKLYALASALGDAAADDVRDGVTFTSAAGIAETGSLIALFSLVEEGCIYDAASAIVIPESVAADVFTPVTLPVDFASQSGKIYLAFVQDALIVGKAGAEQHQMDAYCLRMGGGFSVSLNGCAVYSIGQGW